MTTDFSPYKRNYWLLVLEGMFFLGTFVGFYNANTVIPVFIDTMTHSKQLVGFTLTLGTFIMYFSRLLIGPFMPHIRNHARFSTIVMFSTRTFTLLPALFIFTGMYKTSVYVFIIAIAGMYVCEGVVVPAWSEVFNNTVEGSRHGRLLGWQMLLGGLAGIGAGILINIFFGTKGFDVRIAFGWIFLLGGISAVLSAVMMSRTINAPRPYKTGKVEFLSYFRQLPKYLSHEWDFTKMIVVQFILMCAAMSLPFVILFSSETLQMSQSTVAQLILVQSVGVPVGGWLWGILVDKIGAHNSLRLAGLNLLLPSLLPLAALHVHGSLPAILMFSSMFLSGVSSGIWNVYFVYTVQVVRPESRPAILVLSSVLTMPTAFASYLAGFLADRFGFSILFMICIVLAVAGTILAFRLRAIKVVQAEREQAELTA